MTPNFDHFLDRLIARRRTTAATGLPGRDRAHQFDGVFAAVAELLTQLVEQSSLARFAALNVTLAQPIQLFQTGQILQFHASVLGVISI